MRKPLEKPTKVGNPTGLKKSPPPLGKAHVQRMTPKLVGRNVELFERQERAVRMATSGATFEQIAKALGYSDKGDAWRDVNQALENSRKNLALTVEEYRQKQLIEINMLRVQAHAMRQAENATEKVRFGAMDRLIKLMEREARLVGFDAPVRSEVTGAGGKPIQIDVGSLSREQIARLAAGDTSVLYPVGGAAVGEGPAGARGPGGARGSN